MFNILIELTVLLFPLAKKYVILLFTLLCVEQGGLNSTIYAWTNHYVQKTGLKFV